MESPNEASALATLSMLEERLHRLEFLLHGSSNAVGIPQPAPMPAGRGDTVSRRLTGLQAGLQRLSSKHGVVKDVLEIREMSSSISLGRVLTGSERRPIPRSISSSNRRPPSDDLRHRDHHINCPRSRHLVFRNSFSSHICQGPSHRTHNDFS